MCSKPESVVGKVKFMSGPGRRTEEEERVGRSVRRRRREGVWSTNWRERAEEREVSSFARVQ